MTLKIHGISNYKHLQKEQKGRARVDCQISTSLVLSGLEIVPIVPCDKTSTVTLG